MLFNSIEFLLFLPLVFLCYWFIFKNLKSQNLFIVAISYLFYGWWDWRFLILIAITTLCSFLSGILIEKYEHNRTIQKRISAANISLNLIILCVFKYLNFFGENFAALFRSMNIELDWVTLDVLLPVGISFYTFQALSYTIDVYQHKIKATKDIVAFFAFISFFPQLVAGPIERATNLLPQFLKKRTFDYSMAIDGCRQILWGFFKKVVVADNCASIVNIIWADYANQNSLNLLVGGILFTFQIYGDFSGYSDIAIGTAKLFGIRLMQNFNFPYFATNIAEFWRRWHISLTTWFRDYIYFPLGGSRCSKLKTMRNTLVIFLVSGFWHGANWTFVVWGGYHALLFFPLLLLNKNKKSEQQEHYSRPFKILINSLNMAFTFFLVVIGWIIFRSENITIAADYLTRMFTNLSFQGPLVRKASRALLFVLVLLVFEWPAQHKQHALQIEGHGLFKYPIIRRIFYVLLVILIWAWAGNQASFIYFQF